MHLAVTSNLFADEPLDSALAKIAACGVSDIELSVDTGFKLVSLEDLLDADSRRRMQGILAEHGIRVSALSNHRDGQLVLGPHHEVTDGIHPGSAEEKREYGIRRMKDTARAAAAMEVDVVTGFVGCPDYARWFHWPGQSGWEVHNEPLQRDWSDILGVYREYGVRFAHEPHPKQVIYDTPGAVDSLSLFEEFDVWGFNFDPGNLVLAGVDPVDFIRQLGSRIWYVHAKDVEQTNPTARNHFLAYPRYGEIGRNLRFRIAGWGSLNWHSIITELRLAGYSGAVAVEHEDPTVGRVEGLHQAARYMCPLLLDSEREARWW